MKETIGLYIHIPFCEKMCHYCNFLTFARQEHKINDYINYLIKEIALYQSEEYAVDSIFFGGGTPSYVAGEQIQAIMQAVYDNFQVLEDCEITIEMNPESINEEKLACYLKAGINRFSMGVQSFDNQVLRFMGRLHNRETVYQKLALLKAMGCQNLGIDLMFGNPKQTLEVLQADLEQALQLDIDHISYYSLMIKENTPFERWLATGQMQLLDDEEERDMYHLIQEQLTKNGYEQYEISNFARKHKYSRHNLKYWTLHDYLGLGLGASSNIGLERFTNLASFDSYFQAIDVGRRPIEQVELLNWSEREKEYIMLNMRLLKGFNIQDFNRKFQLDFRSKYQEVLDKHVNYGLIQFEGDYLSFTKLGLDIGNQFYIDII